MKNMLRQFRQDAKVVQDEMFDVAHNHGVTSIHPHTLSRRDDPETSKQGAEDVALRMEACEQRAYDAVRRWAYATANEMERADGVLGRTYGRRLEALERRGLVVREHTRRCHVTLRPAATWRVSDAANP